MLTITCNLKFNDGTSASARVSAQAAQDENLVVYSGEVSRLPRRFEKASPALLLTLFKNLARELSADLSSSTEGEYDYAE